MAILADEIFPKINTGRTSGGNRNGLGNRSASDEATDFFDNPNWKHRAAIFAPRTNVQRGRELPDYFSGEQFWPKYALLTHAIELSLKAFAQYSVENGKALVKEPKQHDLLGWYHSAVIYGLQEEPYMERNIELLNQLHLTHYTRYPHNRTNPIPDVSNIVDDTVDRLILGFTHSINPR